MHCQQTTIFILDCFDLSFARVDDLSHIFEVMIKCFQLIFGIEVLPGCKLELLLQSEHLFSQGDQF